MCADHVNDVRVGGVHQYAPAGRHILHQFVESGPLHLFTLQISDRVEEVKQDAALLELLHKQLLLLCRRSIWNTNTTQTRSYARHISHLGNKKDDAIIKQRFPTTAVKLQCLPPGRRWSYRSTTKTIRTSPITTASTRHHHVNRLRLKCITCSLQCLWTICNWICFLYLSSSLFFLARSQTSSRTRGPPSSLCSDDVDNTHRKPDENFCHFEFKSEWRLESFGQLLNGKKKRDRARPYWQIKMSKKK